MRKNIKFGTLQQDIASEAKKIHAFWVVIWSDHYAGNSKGYFQSVDNFAKSKVFAWHENIDDRGATQVYITDEDIPSIVERRKKLILEIERQNFFLSTIQKRQQYIAIDGRWGKNNPKYIEAIAKREAQKQELADAQNKYDAIVDILKEELKQINFVSSTFCEIEI